MSNFVNLVNKLVDDQETSDFSDRLIKVGTEMLFLSLFNTDRGIDHEKRPPLGNQEQEEIPSWPTF